MGLAAALPVRLIRSFHWTLSGWLDPGETTMVAERKKPVNPEGRLGDGDTLW